MPTDYGLGNGGNVNTFSPEWLQSMYPYVTFGPQMAQMLAQLQFGAGLDAQNQNNQTSMQLAQGMASNRFADNIASKLALNGMGAFPQAGSAFGGGNWGVQQVKPPNIMDIFQQMNSGLGNIFGGGGGGQPAYPGAPARDYTQAPAGGIPWQMVNQQTGGGMNPGAPARDYTQAPAGGIPPWMQWPAPGAQPVGGFQGNQNPATGNNGGNIGGLPTPGAAQGNTMGLTDADAVNALRTGNELLALYIRRVIAGVEAFNPAKAAQLGYHAPAGPTDAPIGFGGIGPRGTGFGQQVSDFVDWSSGSPTIGGRPLSGQGPRGQSFGGQQNPFAPLHQLAFGQGGFGPAYFSAGMLGTGSPGFGAPRTNLTGYYGASPDQRQAQDYFMQSQAGYSPQQLAYERQTFTPGARIQNPATFGYR